MNNTTFLKNTLSVKMIRTNKLAKLLSWIVPSIVIVFGFLLGLFPPHGVKGAISVVVLIGAIGGVFAGWLRHRTLPEYIAIDNKGVHYTTKRGKKKNILWEDVTSTRQLKGYEDYMLSYRTKKNRIDWIPIGPSIGQIVQTEWYKYLKEKEMQTKGAKNG